jgi:DNA-binding MarR family transcriptional regulator
VAEARWLDEAQQRAWRAFQIMQARMNAQLARDLSAHSELSYQDYMVLVVLTGQPDGQARLFQVARDLGWEKSRASHQVTRMADRGLVEKLKSCDDGRGAVVSVTALGRERIEAAAPSHVEAVRRLFIDRLSSRQLNAVADVALIVLAAVVAEEEAEPARSEDCPAGATANGPATGARTPVS